MDQPTGNENVDPAVRTGTGTGARSSQMTWDEGMGQLDTYAERARVALPAAPPGLMDGYMRYWPWVSIVLGILGILVSIIALVLGAGAGALMVVFGGAAGVGFSGALFVTLIVGLIINVLEVIGGYLMLKRRLTGWWLLAVGLVVSVLSSLFGRSIIVLIFTLLIAYIHLQVKPNYR